MKWGYITNNAFSDLHEEVFALLNGVGDKELSLWVDGSYYAGSSCSQSSVAGIVTLANDPEKAPVFSVACDISAMDIQQNYFSEFWAATLGVECLQKFNLKHLYYDCQTTEHRIGILRGHGDSSRRLESYTKEREQYPILYQRLEDALSFHPDLILAHKKRYMDRIPLADKLAGAARKRNIVEIFSTAQEFDIPCLYQILDECGRTRQMTFYDRMESYDMGTAHAAPDSLIDIENWGDNGSQGNTP